MYVCFVYIAYFRKVILGTYVGKSIRSSDELKVEAVIDLARLIYWEQSILVHMKKIVRMEPHDVESRQGKRVMFTLYTCSHAF